jgi:hypothetical protein
VAEVGKQLGDWLKRTRGADGGGGGDQGD